MQMVYKSKRPFSALAYGMMMGSSDYFGENLSIEVDDQSTDGMSHVIFTLTKA